MSLRVTRIDWARNLKRLAGSSRDFGANCQHHLDSICGLWLLLIVAFDTILVLLVVINILVLVVSSFLQSSPLMSLHDQI